MHPPTGVEQPTAASWLKLFDRQRVRVTVVLHRNLYTLTTIYIVRVELIRPLCYLPGSRYGTWR